MYQIAFGLLEDNTHAWWFHDLFRLIFSLLEILVAWLIPFTYQILVKIANNTIISGDVVRVIFGRVQLILGVIMIFKLSMAVIQYIINPDMMDDKSKGLSGIITRIIIMLVLLTSIVPLNIPKSSIVEGSYNDYLRDDGLLFGTLYFAQSRILNTNIIGTIILGDENSKNGSFDDPEFAGNQLALLVMKTVIRPNDYDGTTIGKCDDEDKCICPRSEIDTEEYGSKEEDQKQYDRYYNDPTLTASQLLDDMRNIKCFDDSLGPFNLDGEAKYAYTYLPIVGGILGGFVLITLISFCVDVAIRAIKLAILRLIAPIPIMSYIDPKSGQNGAFQNWVKTLTKTFLDLFVRLAIIFFVILVVRSIADDISSGNFKAFDFSTPVGAFATIFIIIGLFFFAKQAPQFIYEALGMKYDKGAGVFSGLGKIAATGMALGGSIGSARTNLSASREEGTGALGTAGSTVLGGASGLITGLKAAAGAKDHPTQAVRDAQNKRNALRASHSTMWGRTKDSLSGMVGGSTAYERDQAYIDANKNIFDLYDRMAQQADSNGKNTISGGYKYEWTNKDGTKGSAVARTGTVKDFKDAYEKVKASGAEADVQAMYEAQYKTAQDHLMSAVMQGRSDITDGAGVKIHVDIENGNSFITEMDNAYKEALHYADGIDNVDLGKTGGSFKGAHFTAADNARGMERSSGYKARKAASGASKK